MVRIALGVALCACGPGPTTSPVAPSITFKGDGTRLPAGERAELWVSWSATCGPGPFDWAAAAKAPRHDSEPCQFRDYTAEVRCDQPCEIELRADPPQAARDRLEVDSKRGAPHDHSLWFAVRPLAAELDVVVTLRSGRDTSQLAHHYTTVAPD